MLILHSDSLVSDGQNIQKAEREKEEETLDGDKVDRFFCLQRVSEIQIITAMTRLSGCHLQWKGVKLSIVPCQSCLYCTIGSDSTAKPLKGAPVNIFNRLYWYEVGYGSFFFFVYLALTGGRVVCSSIWLKQQERRVVQWSTGRAGQPLWVT